VNEELLNWVVDLLEKRPEDLHDEEGFPTEECERLIRTIHAQKDSKDTVLDEVEENLMNLLRYQLLEVRGGDDTIVIDGKDCTLSPNQNKPGITLTLTDSSGKALGDFYVEGVTVRRTGGER